MDLGTCEKTSFNTCFVICWNPTVGFVCVRANPTVGFRKNTKYMLKHVLLHVPETTCLNAKVIGTRMFIHTERIRSYAQGNC